MCRAKWTLLNYIIYGMVMVYHDARRDDGVQKMIDVELFTVKSENKAKF